MPEKDVFRDTPIRYIGYCNEIGEAFRPLVRRRIVEATYAVAFGYVLADTLDKAYKKKQQYENAPNQWSKVLICAGDSLLWQSLATIIIPGFVINRICAGSIYGLGKTLLAKNKAPISTAISLLSIPFIVHPIDSAVTYLMDNTYRKFCY